MHAWLTGISYWDSKQNGAIVNVVIYTSYFLAMTSQNVCYEKCLIHLGTIRLARFIPKAKQMIFLSFKSRHYFIYIY